MSQQLGVQSFPSFLVFRGTEEEKDLRVSGMHRVVKRVASAIASVATQDDKKAYLERMRFERLARLASGEEVDEVEEEADLQWYEYPNTTRTHVPLPTSRTWDMDHSGNLFQLEVTSDHHTTVSYYNYPFAGHGHDNHNG
jgi:hypothetical protein